MFMPWIINKRVCTYAQKIDKYVLKIEKKCIKHHVIKIKKDVWKISKIVISSTYKFIKFKSCININSLF